MLKAIAIGMFTYITYPLVVEHGLVPNGIGWCLLYAFSVVGAVSFVEGRG
tara:strand:+ start:1089 stop:1238 length:150 start_codon:yes stop_codon:yes gene_type:complete